MQVSDIIKALRLKPHPNEGGFYVETYRSQEMIPREHLPAKYQSDKNFSTAIYYLLTPDTFSTMHRLQTDEIFHFYLGDPITMLHLYPDGSSHTLVMGQDILRNQFCQVTVPQNVWQGAHLNPRGKYALLGTTVAPGFDFSDYEEGNCQELSLRYPDRTDLIVKLTR